MEGKEADLVTITALWDKYHYNPPFHRWGSWDIGKSRKLPHAKSGAVCSKKQAVSSIYILKVLKWYNYFFLTLCKISDESSALLKWMIHQTVALLQFSLSATNITIYRAYNFISFFYYIWLLFPGSAVSIPVTCFNTRVLC